MNYFESKETNRNGLFIYLYNKEIKMASSQSVTQKRKITRIKSFEKGIFKTGEKPSDFSGIWKGKTRTLAEIRKKAWTRK